MPRPPVVDIAARAIGAGHPVYIIAEAGVNHDGSLSKAKELVHAAKDAGADAVKFQVFSADRLVTSNAPTCQYQKDHAPGARTQLDLLKSLELKHDDLVELKNLARDLSIDFLATPFGLTELALLTELGVPAIKIASPDIINVPLLIAAAETNLPIIASTGAATMDEIELGVRTIRRNRHQERLILMHCVSSYPTDPADARLASIQVLSGHFTVPVGFSDHTADAEFSALAVAAGACLLEKHLTLSRSQEGPDHFFSLEPAQFVQYVSCARNASASLGDGRLAPSTTELDVRNLARRSIVAVRDIQTGTRLKAEDLDVRRPAGGIAPSEWACVIGRVTASDIPAETQLDWSMLAPDNG